MAEDKEGSIHRETNPILEKIGKERLRMIASLGLAAAALLGISGKPNTGVGVLVEVPNPTTGEQVSVGVMTSSVEEDNPFFGFGGSSFKKNINNIKAFTVKVGNVNLTIATATVEGEDDIKTIGIYPNVETLLGSK